MIVVHLGEDEEGPDPMMVRIRYHHITRSELLAAFRPMKTPKMTTTTIGFDRQSTPRRFDSGI